MITLSVEERHRFADWLLQEAATDQALAEQMDQLPLTANLATRKRQEAKLKQLVASLVRPGESFVVRG